MLRLALLLQIPLKRLLEDLQTAGTVQDEFLVRSNLLFGSLFLFLVSQGLLSTLSALILQIGRDEERVQSAVVRSVPPSTQTSRVDSFLRSHHVN